MSLAIDAGKLGLRGECNVTDLKSGENCRVQANHPLEVAVAQCSATTLPVKQIAVGQKTHDCAQYEQYGKS